MMFKILLVGLLLPSGLSMKLQGASTPKMALGAVGTHAESVAEMQKIFARPDKEHRHAMELISNSLTLPKALDVLKNTSFAKDPAMKQITSLITGSQFLRSGTIDAHDGFGGLDGARKLLNSMIHEAQSKYDAEIAKCTAYYASQCALMEVARGQISAANFIAATSRALILDAQGNIDKCEKAIPVTKQELKDHNRKCKVELKAMDKRLKIIMGDIAVMTMILKMSDCDAKLLQTDKMTMLRCEDACTKQPFVQFGEGSLQDELNQLSSPETKGIMQQSFSELFDEDDEDASSDSEDSLLQEAADPKKKMKMPKKPKKKMKFNRPPVPVTKVPGNPCTDPNMGAPAPPKKRGGKCTLKKSPRCYKLQGRFLQIQAEIMDARDQLMSEISETEHTCDETKKALEASIENDNALLSSSNTKLAAATEKEASAGEEGRQVNKENSQYNADLVKQMKICSTNYMNFETEICALRKIRGDVFKKMVKGHKGFFQDCEVSPWVPEECTKKCAGGEQKLVRAVLKHPDGGSKCLPLKAERKCNLSPCAVNCVLQTWSGWSKCSAKCGGGVKSRARDVKVPMLHGGTPCEGTVETTACNVAACEKDCVLHPWTKWSGCSKDCDGGSKKRVRMIKEPSEGSGECAGEWDKTRLEYVDCAMHRCKVPNAKEVMKCNKTLDVILLLDGTPKSGKEGWAAEVKAANLFIDAFSGPGITAKPNFAVLHYTGPRTWSGVSKCAGGGKKKVDMEKTCKVKIASHFEEDMKKVKGVISGLQFTPGSKLLSLALMVTESELALGRKAYRTIVVVFIDGQPLSYRKTRITSHSIRKKARLLYVPVVKFSPLASVKEWASRRWEENIVKVETSKELADAATGTHLVANICPKSFPKLKMKKR